MYFADIVQLPKRWVWIRATSLCCTWISFEVSLHSDNVIHMDGPCSRSRLLMLNLSTSLWIALPTLMVCVLCYRIHLLVVPLSLRGKLTWCTPQDRNNTLLSTLMYYTKPRPVCRLRGSGEYTVTPFETWHPFRYLRSSREIRPLYREYALIREIHSPIIFLQDNWCGWSEEGNGPNTVYISSSWSIHTYI